jgi:hypothetical protein
VHLLLALRLAGKVVGHGKEGEAELIS